jgi:hypothetical protein
VFLYLGAQISAGKQAKGGASNIYQLVVGYTVFCKEENVYQVIPQHCCRYGPGDKLVNKNGATLVLMIQCDLPAAGTAKKTFFSPSSFISPYSVPPKVSVVLSYQDSTLSISSCLSIVDSPS